MGCHRDRRVSDRNGLRRATAMGTVWLLAAALSTLGAAAAAGEGGTRGTTIRRGTASPGTPAASTAAPRSTSSSSVGAYRGIGHYRGAGATPDRSGQAQGWPVRPPYFPGLDHDTTSIRTWSGDGAHVVYVPQPVYVIQDTQPQVVVVEQSPPPPPVVVVVQAPPAAAPPVPVAPPSDAERAPPRPPATAGSAIFTVVPTDAAVYLDDRFLGTGSDLAGSAAVITLAPGVHMIEVSHPDHTIERLVFGVDGKRLHITVDLTQTRPSRRIRLDAAG